MNPMISTSTQIAAVTSATISGVAGYVAYLETVAQSGSLYAPGAAETAGHIGAAVGGSAALIHEGPELLPPPRLAEEEYAPRPPLLDNKIGLYPAPDDVLIG